MDPEIVRDKHGFEAANGRDFLWRAKRDGETRDQYERSLRETFEKLVLLRVSSEFAKDATQQDQTTLTSRGIENKPRRNDPSISQTGSSKSEPPKIRYKKTGGAADGAGENYEWKMLTLVFLRLLAAGYEFQLASNMEAAGLFDDIVVRYRENSSDPWRVACLQLKHKQNGTIMKPELLGLSGAFSLVKYCVSYVSLKSSTEKEQKLLDGCQNVIFTNARISDNLVDVVGTDKLLTTGGKVVSFKAGGEVYQELCEWVDFKDTLTELQGQVDGLTDDKVGVRIKDALSSVAYQNKAVASWRDELIKTTTLQNLKDLVKKLVPVTDRSTYLSFLADLKVYTNQVHESELETKIKEALGKVWIHNDNLEAAVMLHELQSRVKSWWQKESFFLAQDSHLWLGVVKSQTDIFSKSTIAGLTKRGLEFTENSLLVIHDIISKFAKTTGIFNLRVDFRTAASSLKVHQALATFGANENVLHVNVKALLDREHDVLSAWATRWCRVLVVECNLELEQKHAARISSKILEVFETKNQNKLLVLVAPERHLLNVQLHCVKSYMRFNDNFLWSDLTDEAKEDILACKINFNGSMESEASLSELVDVDEGFVNKVDLEVISQLLTGDVSCGKDLDEESQFFITRRLQKSADGVPFVVNSVSDIQTNVVLVVAEPGMGKSTLISHLAKSAKAEDPLAWIVHIKLNDCVQYLKEIDVENFDEDAAKKFLEKSALNPGNHLEKLLFRTLQQKLVVFVDGVDEVCPHYEEKVFLLLSFLKDMKFCQLWVASRPVFQTKLEDRLRVRALRLVAFSEQDQKEFFYKFWETYVPSATIEKCKNATDSLFAWITDSLGKDNPILEVPLMAAMIAEIFQEQIFAALDNDNFEFNNMKRLDIMDLYEKFVAKKFELYCIEKKKIPSRDLAANLNDDETLQKSIHSKHRLAALRVLFAPEEISNLQFEGNERFDADLATYLKEVSDGREKMGIIDNVIDGVPHFVHRSFAEYFAASWLALNFKTNGELIQRIFTDPAYKLVYQMFNRFLAENHPLHVSVLGRDRVAIERFLSSEPPIDVNEPDDGGRTPLHLAVILSATDQHPDCARILECLLQKHNAKLAVADEVLGLAPVQYAVCSRAWVALHAILESGGRFMEKTSFVLNSMIFVQKLLGWPRKDVGLMLGAARDASVLVVRCLFETHGGKFNCRGLKGETMVHWAAEGGNVQTLEYLSSNGLALDDKDIENNTALHYARSPQTVHYLVEHGLDLEAINKQGMTAFQDAAQKGAADLMNAFLELKASFKVRGPVQPPDLRLNTALLCAAFAGSLASVQNLVFMGASVEHRDDKGHTATWVAMNRERVEVMEWLLLRSCYNGDTQLTAACRLGDPDIVNFILSRGADTEAKVWRGQTALILASQAGHLHIAKQLLAYGACVESRDDDGCTSLHVASTRGHGQVVALLLSHGADITAENNKGDMPLHAAVASGKLDLVKLLLEKGAKVDCPRKVGWTPLHEASLLRRYQHVDLLLQHGAYVNAVDEKGQSPLHAAMWYDNLDVVELLLEKGARVNSRDVYGWTPLDRAIMNGRHQSATLMQRERRDSTQELE